MPGADAQSPFDVAIVGFGPSGAVAAGLLGGMGLRVFVCDRQTSVYDKPRAISLDHEILRVFQQLGLADQVLPFTEPFTDSRYHGVDGRLIKCLSTIAPPYPLGYPPSVVFSQPPVEALLRAHAASLATVEVALGVELRSLVQDDDGVSLGLRHVDGDGVDGAGGGGDGKAGASAERTLRARYVIGCDGASSTLRELAGIPLVDLRFDEPWLVVDAHVNERGLAKLPKTSMQYCEPERPCSLIIGPGNHRRWEISLNADEDPQQAATPAGAWALLSRWLTPDDARLWRQASYRFHALVAERWRAGRVFVAGDAAHQQPPFLGQGMCQGIRDVVNLAWKLEAVLHGRAGDALLDSYGDERGLHVRQLTERIKGIGALICERDVATARARDQRLIDEAGGDVQATPRQDVLPRLAAGLIDGDSGHAAVGSLFPQPWLVRHGRRVRLDAVAGCGWRLVVDATADRWLAAAEAPPALDALRLLGVTPVRVVGARSARDEEPAAVSHAAGHTASAAPGDVAPAGASAVGRDSAPAVRAAAATAMPLDDSPLTEADGVLAGWFARHRCGAALVRPDHYVYGVCGEPAELPRLLDSLARRLGAPTTAAHHQETA